MQNIRPLSIQARDLRRELQLGSQRITIFDQLDFSVGAGQSCAILGASGSGKTTLLGVLAGMDAPDKGVVEINRAGQLDNIYSHDEDWRAALRGQCMGFVFQDFQLIADMTALDNVLVPLQLLNNGSIEQARYWLQQVGLADRLNHYPAQLSGGEQQRVALARAFAHRPALLLADEPTGSLDAATAEKIIELLFALHRDTQSTMLLVTHDEHLAARCDMLFKLSPRALS